MAYDPASTRLHRTYEVTLVPTDGEKPMSFSVNLAYDVDDKFAAVENGYVVQPDSVLAHLAAVNRLRRLSDKGRVNVTRSDIDDAKWQIKLVRQQLKRPS
jgi:hypothetical protein